MGVCGAEVGHSLCGTSVGFKVCPVPAEFPTEVPAQELCHCLHPHYRIELILSARWTPSELSLVLILFVVFVDRVSVIRWRGSGLGTSGSRLCYLQMMWSFWCLQTRTFSMNWVSSQLVSKSAPLSPRPWF